MCFKAPDVQFQQLFLIRYLVFFEERLKNFLNIIKVRSTGFNLLENFFRQERLQQRIVAGAPEPYDLLYKIKEKWVAFNMALLANKVDQTIPAMAELIDFSGDVAQQTFGSDFVEVNREKLG